MKVTGIIAEYNPLHKGHIHLMDYSKDKLNSDYTIVIMSGDYVERGCPAIISKYERTRLALMSGADLVLELPFPYSCSSIDYFANGAIYTLNKLNIVDNLLFGSESGDIASLTEAAEHIQNSVNFNDNILKASLREGNTYAKANVAAYTNDANIATLLNSPNNNLGIHYIKSLLETSSNIKPVTIKRIISDHHDTSDGALSSSAIRSILFDSQADKSSLLKQLPDNIFTELNNYLENNYAIDENILSPMLFYKLHDIEASSSSVNAAVAILTEYLDVSEALAHKILNYYKKALTYSELCELLKSKDLTYTRISRALLHILLSVKTSKVNEYRNNGYSFYSRILGFRKDASGLISEINNAADIPLITKLADYEHTLSSFYSERNNELYNIAASMLRAEINASNLYKKAACTQYRQQYISEFEQQLIIL